MVETILIARWIGMIVLIIILFSAFQFFMNIHPPRFKSNNNPSNLGLDYENVSFTTSDNIKIKAWLIESKKANGTVIVGHGYPFDKGNILPVALFLYPDYNLLFYDHRYFGESEGRITTGGFKEVEDVKAAVEFARKRFPKQPIALYGFSLSASSMLMSRENVNAIIADSPYSDLNKIINAVYFIFGPLRYPFVWTTAVLSKIIFGVYPIDISAAEAIRDSQIPMLVIHGDKDSQIPVENSYILKENNPDIELWIAKGADHGQAHALYKEEYEKRVKEFLRKYIK